MKKLTFFLTAFAATVLVVGCDGLGSKDDAQTQQTIRIGTEGNYPPFSFHDKNNKLTGFDVELAREVAKRLNLTPEFLETQWDAIFAGLESTRFDVIANQVDLSNPVRQEKYLLSQPYSFDNSVIVVKSDNNNVHSYADLKGLKAAQSLTSNHQQNAKDNGAEILPIESLSQAIELVKQGRVDVTLNSKIAVLAYFQAISSPGVKIVYEDKNKTGIGFVFRKDEDKLLADFNHVIGEMKKDGTLKALSIEWLGQDVTE